MNVSLFTLKLFQQGVGSVTLTPALAAQLESLVWSVVSTDPRAIH